MAKCGAKLKEVDPIVVQILAQKQRTKEQIAAVLGMSVSTYMLRQSQNPEISEAYKRGRFGGRAAFQTRFFDLAWEAKQPGVTVFAAKNYLDMTDKQERGGPGDFEKHRRQLTDDEITERLERAFAMSGDNGEEGDNGSG